MLRTIILSFTVIVLSSCFAISQSKLAPTEFQIDSLVGDWTDETKPGLALCVLNNGKIEFQKNWGLANLEHNIPIDNNTVFLFPDKSDQILAFSILLLVERGSIGLNNKIGQYLPDLPKHIKNITVDQLLNHNSGLITLSVLNEMDGKRDADMVSQGDFEHLINMPISIDVDNSGSHQYVRVGLRLLQLILEKQSGQTFSAFAEQKIFIPLGMKNSQIVSNSKIISNKAQGYRRSQEGFQVSFETNNYLKCDALYSTTKDILLWVDNFWRPKIGNAEIWKKMDLFVMDKGQPVSKHNRSQFLGQHRYWKYFGTDKYYQIGMTEGYAAKTVRFPEHDLAIVVMGNFGDYNGFIASACSDLYLKPFFTSNENPNQSLNYSGHSSQKLNQFVGHYWDYSWETKIDVTFENDSLWLNDRTYNWRAYMKPINETQFFIQRRAGYVVELKETPKGREMIFMIPDQPELKLVKVSVGDKALELKSLEGKYASADLQKHCTLKIVDGKISLVMKRQAPISFQPLSKDEFNSSNWHFSRLELVRGTNGEVEGFNINNGLVKNLFFRKLPQFEEIN